MLKKIFIHVGPPKTGTSAIQKWLNYNTDFLFSNGIMYPNHSTDKNGVSSGNLLSIYSKKKTGDYYLDLIKVDKILSDFEKSELNILLLSSEFFFTRLHEIKNAIPSVTVIFYIRNPMEKRESLYNQGIKRHFFTHKYPAILNAKISDLLVIDNFLNKFPRESSLIRLYGIKYFHNGNIISDLLNLLGIDHQTEVESINSSYQFEALEFKRWLNNFTLRDLKVDADRILQNYSGGTSIFSLISPHLYKKQAEIDAVALEKFFQNINIPGAEFFINDIRNQNQNQYYKQQLTDKEFENVCLYLKENLGDKSTKLLKLINEDSSNNNPNYLSIFLRIFNNHQKQTIVKRVITFFKKGQTHSKIKHIDGLSRLRKKLSIQKKVKDVEILIQTALFAEANNNLDFALTLMKEAQKKKPNAKFIENKIRKYKQKI